MGSVIAIEDAQGTRRFQASGSHTTPNGKWSARAPGYRLGGFDVGQVARSMGHDEAGRVESDGHQEYVFDDEGLLAEVKGGAQEGYLYDGLGRLVGKVRADGQLAEALVHDGAQLVEAWRSGSLAWTATWGPGLDNLVSIIDEQADEYLTLDDGKGSVIAWVKAGETQATTWAEYTVEGRATYHHERAGTTCVEEDDVRCDKPFDVPFGFHSAYGSSTTGLLYFRSRWYSPESGEWLSQDPLGNVDSDNLYAFNGFDPVNFVDPWGLEKGGGKYCTADGFCELADPSSRATVVKSEKSGKPICEGCILDRSQSLGDGIGGRDEQPPQPPAPAQPERTVRTPERQIATKKPATPAKKPLTSLTPAQIEQEVAAMSDEELNIIGTRIEAPLKMTPARARALYESITKRDFFPQDYVANTLMDGYFAANAASQADGFELIASSTLEEVNGQVRGLLLGGIIGAAAKGVPAGRRVNMPAWKKVLVDMDEVASGHMAGGRRLAPGNKKDVFPAGMTERQVERAIRHAYRHGEVLQSQAPDRVFVRGPFGSGVIEMWVNTATKTIETAWPKF